MGSTANDNGSAYEETMTHEKQMQNDIEKAELQSQIDKLKEQQLKTWKKVIELSKKIE